MVQFEVATNSLLLSQAKVGLGFYGLKSETEFMTVEKDKENNNVLNKIFTLPNDQTIEIPIIGVDVKLSDARYEYERHDYTFFEMLGDFGGFIDGLTLIAYGLTKSYS